MFIAGWRSPTMPARYRAEAKAELAFDQYERISDKHGPVLRSKPGPAKRARALNGDGT